MRKKQQHVRTFRGYAKSLSVTILLPRKIEKRLLNLQKIRKCIWCVLLCCSQSCNQNHLFPFIREKTTVETIHTLASHTSHPVHILLVSYFEFSLSPSDVYLVLIG